MILGLTLQKHQYQYVMISNDNTAEPQKVYYIQSTSDNNAVSTIANHIIESTSTEQFAFSIEPISFDDYLCDHFQVTGLNIEQLIISYEETDKWYSDQEAAYSRKAAHELAAKYSFTVKESGVNMVKLNRKCFMRLKTFNNLRF